MLYFKVNLYIYVNSAWRALVVLMQLEILQCAKFVLFVFLSLSLSLWFIRSTNIAMKKVYSSYYIYLVSFSFWHLGIDIIKRQTTKKNSNNNNHIKFLNHYFTLFLICNNREKKFNLISIFLIRKKYISINCTYHLTFVI